MRADKRPSLQRTLPGKHLVQAHLHDGISIRTSGGRGPPTHGRFGRPTGMHRESIGAPARDRCATNDGVRRLTARAAARFRGQRRRQTNHLRSGAVCTSAWVVHRSRNIGEAQPKREDLQMQHRPRTNQELKRMQQGSDDGHDELSLFGMACNLNRRKAYSVSGSHNTGPIEHCRSRLLSQDVHRLRRRPARFVFTVATVSVV